MKNSLSKTLGGLIMSVALIAGTNSAFANATAGSLSLEEVSSVELKFTKVADYGTALSDLLAGKKAPGAQGARVDIHFTGDTKGVLSGTMSGIDYANIRADGRFELNIHAEIVTPDGARIAYQATGVSIPQADGTAKIREAAKLTTGSSKYAWVNGLAFIAEGVVNPAEGIVKLTLYK